MIIDEYATGHVRCRSRPYETHGMFTVASIVWLCICTLSSHVWVRLRTALTPCLPGRPHDPLCVPLRKPGLNRD